MSTQTEGVLAILAAFMVLFSAMWEPMVSAIVAAGCLILFGIYRLVRTRRG